MTNNLVPYPTMKESGVEWLGKVTEHWEVRGLRANLPVTYHFGGLMLI